MNLYIVPIVKVGVSKNNELIKHNKIFSMVEYPMHTHSLRERENSSRHVRETMVNFFLKNLTTGPK